MKKHLQIIATLVVLISCQTAPQKNANHPTNQRQVAGELDNEAVWGKYCKTPNGGGANSTEIPEPNYANPEVDALVKNFQSISLNSFYLYPAIVRVYGLKKATNQTEMAHNFLIYLCGEFRDRATMVEAKIKWFGKFNKLAKKKQGPVDPKKDIWMQMTAPSYQKFINFTADLWNARRRSMEYAKSNIVKIGKYDLVDRPVPGMTVCEVKHIFANYITSPNNYDFENIALSAAEKKEKKNKKKSGDFGSEYLYYEEMENPSTFVDGTEEQPGETPVGITAATPPSTEKSLQKYNADYDAYKKNCSADDIADYYDFRGDSNYKPNSPESNGMIWYTLMIANACESPTKAKSIKLKAGITAPRNTITDQDCANYFQKPFQSRWNAAKAGLSTWMLREREFDEKFSDDGGQTLVVVPHLMKNTDADQKPFGFRFTLSETDPSIRNFMVKDNFSTSFLSSDLGFNSIRPTNFDQKAELTYERLRDAVNRHTNWYQSGWDDGLGTDKSIKEQAYSPFVASSYEPHESDGFTACGITVSCPPDGYKHWMFVFRIKGENWYTSADAAEGKPLDFDKMWFDETSLGTTGLAKSEKAWDRLGTALEDELTGGAILYLHRITTEGGIVEDDTKPPTSMTENNGFLEGIPPEAVAIAKRTVVDKANDSTVSCSVYKHKEKYYIGTAYENESTDYLEGVQDTNKNNQINIGFTALAKKQLTTPMQSTTLKAFFWKNKIKKKVKKPQVFGERIYSRFEAGVEKQIVTSAKGKIQYVNSITFSRDYIGLIDKACDTSVNFAD